jgi:hypothetical protein
MAVETIVPRSRRALLAAGLGGLVAAAGSALGRPLAVRAANGDPVVAGSVEDATATTGVTTTTGNGLQGTSSDAAASGVYGESTAGAYGVAGRSPSGVGVLGEGSWGVKALGGADGYAVHAFNPWSGGVGIYAEAVEPAVKAVGVYAKSAVEAKSFGNGTAVLGFSGAGDPPAAPAKTGIYGYAAQDGSARGVVGESVDGIGVSGTSNSATGVYGGSDSGRGVYGSSGSGSGVYGDSSSGNAVQAFSYSGRGVYATSNSNIGIYGISTSNIGVIGNTPASDKPAVVGNAYGGNTGVFGWSSAGGPLPTAPAKTGVYGKATQDVNARGVVGQSTAGQGVRGEATTGTGIYAIATTGTALRAEGAVRFKTSGLATIAADTRSVIVTPAGLDLTTSSKILTQLQGDAGGSTVVQRVAVNATANTFTIYLTANAVRAVKVSWFVIS